jgi:hypothetical protein
MRPKKRYMRIGSWWTLIPIMAVDFAVTAAVLITVAKLLEDSDA